MYVPVLILDSPNIVCNNEYTHSLTAIIQVNLG